MLQFLYSPKITKIIISLASKHPLDTLTFWTTRQLHLPCSWFPNFPKFILDCTTCKARSYELRRIKTLQTSIEADETFRESCERGEKPEMSKVTDPSFIICIVMLRCRHFQCESLNENREDESKITFLSFFTYFFPTQQWEIFWRGIST